MRVLVMSNCVMATYVACLQALRPDWEVRGVGLDEAGAWLARGVKPEFLRYAGACDLYFGWPLDNHGLADVLNPQADKIIVPPLHFRGLHPDLATLDGFRGPFSRDAANTQTSLIALAAKWLEYRVEQACALYCERSYEALGFFQLYQSECERLLALFGASGIDLREELRDWEQRGDFFYVCHHPRVFVIVDIVRRALVDRYLDRQRFAGSASLRDTLQDDLAWSETWPVYPEIARRIGFAGGLTWRLPPPLDGQPLSLHEMVERTFRALDDTPSGWRETGFIVEAAAILARLGRP